MKTLSQLVFLLNPEQLKQFHTSLLDVGIYEEYGGKNRAKKLKALKAGSTGKMKKLYVAVSKSNKQEWDCMMGILALEH